MVVSKLCWCLAKPESCSRGHDKTLPAGLGSVESGILSGPRGLRSSLIHVQLAAINLTLPGTGNGHFPVLQEHLALDREWQGTQPASHEGRDAAFL